MTFKAIPRLQTKLLYPLKNTALIKINLLLKLIMLKLQNL